MSDTTATAIDGATIAADAEPTDPLARHSLEALAELRATMQERPRLERELMEYLSPKARELYREVCDAGSDVYVAEVRLHVAELCRHFPGLAPAILLTWAHVIDCRLDNVGACCADGGLIDA